MKPGVFLVMVILVLFSCKKQENKPAPPPASLPGGKGGDYFLVVFSKYNGSSKASRMYFKYGADKMPADTTAYDEVQNTMVEPGLGPHVHFVSLKKGTYFLHAAANNLTADTVLYLTDSTAKNLDIFMHLK